MNKFLVGSLVAMSVAAIIGYRKDDSVVVKATESNSDKKSETVVADKSVEEPIVTKAKQRLVVGHMSYPEYLRRVNQMAQLLKNDGEDLTEATVQETVPTLNSVQCAIANKSRKPIVMANIDSLIGTVEGCPSIEVEEVSIGDSTAFIITADYEQRRVTLSIVANDGIYNYQWLSTDSYMLNTVPLPNIADTKFPTEIGQYLQNYVNMVDML